MMYKIITSLNTFPEVVESDGEGFDSLEKAELICNIIKSYYSKAKEYEMKLMKQLHLFSDEYDKNILKILQENEYKLKESCDTQNHD